MMPLNFARSLLGLTKLFDHGIQRLLGNSFTDLNKIVSIAKVTQCKIGSSIFQRRINAVKLCGSKLG